MISLYPITQKEALMNNQPISNLHRSAPPWAWRLLPHQARSLPAASGSRWLLVNEGTVWITQAQHAANAAPPEDIWLHAGDSLALPPGSSWVLEAGAEAELSLAEPAPAASAEHVKRGWREFSWARFSSWPGTPRTGGQN
jgi:hypothetical protein